MSRWHWLGWCLCAKDRSFRRQAFATAVDAILEASAILLHLFWYLFPFLLLCVNKKIFETNFVVSRGFLMLCMLAMAHTVLMVGGKSIFWRTMVSVFRVEGRQNWKIPTGWISRTRVWKTNVNGMQTTRGAKRVQNPVVSTHTLQHITTKQVLILILADCALKRIVL